MVLFHPEFTDCVLVVMELRHGKMGDVKRQTAEREMKKERWETGDCFFALFEIVFPLCVLWSS